ISKPPPLQSPTACSFPPPAWATDNLTSTKLCRPGWKHSKTTHSFNFAQMPVQVSPGQAFFLLDHFLPARREVWRLHNAGDTGAWKPFARLVHTDITG